MPTKSLPNCVDSSIAAGIESTRQDSFFEQSNLEYRTRLANAEDMEILCEVNYNLFAQGVFSASISSVRARNLSVFDANPLTFANVEARIGDTFVTVGMSSVLPLNSYGRSVYCRSGGLKDIELRGCHIAAPDEWSDAFVVFIIGFLPTARGRLRDRPFTAISNVVFDHCSTVVAAMRQRHPEQSHVRLLAQTDRSNGGMGRVFRRGGTYTGMTTGDGWPLYELVVRLPAEIPNRLNLHGAMLDSFRRVSRARSSADLAVEW
jgi:hypothetical protein